MCGIFGTVNLPKADNRSTIFNSLGHRGPDEWNYISENNIELFHTRLAIQDLTENGRQPMKHKGLFISFNGEIYNHMELRKKHSLIHTSRSDTMTILLMFEKLGMDMLNEFDGMFAFALYDSNREKFYIVRDRAGKKPLYYWRSAEKIAFSSELKTLYSVVHPSINQQSIADYLYLGYSFRSRTVYKDVTELENGSVLEIDLRSNAFHKWKWFDMSDHYHTVKMSEQEALKEVDTRLHKSILSRLDSSDVEVGTFLSGGIDSGLITAIASSYKPNLRTFNISIPGAYDESGLAAQVAEKYKTNHSVINISYDHLKNDFEKIVTNYGEPFRESSAIPSYYVSKAAKEHITVVLNGDGADELFGGYRRYVPFRYFDFFTSSAMVKQIIKGVSAVFPISNEKKSLYNYIFRLLRFAREENLVKTYSAATTDLLVDFEDEFWMKPDTTEFQNMLEEVSAMNLSGLRKMQLADFNALLFSTLLPKMDIATMAFSLEARSPFLGKDLLEFAPTLEDKYIVRGVTTKYLLRQLAKQYLPQNIAAKPKMGFEVPLKAWINKDLNEILNDHLNSSNAVYPHYIDRKFVSDLNRGKVKISAEKRAKILYAILCLEVWHKNLAHHTPVVHRSSETANR